MAVARRAIRACSILTLALAGGASTVFAQQINLGPAADIAWDQPRASWGFVRLGTDELVGPGFDFIGALLDTGANGVVLGQLAYFDEDFNFREDLYDVEQRPDGSKVEFRELGVAGFEYFDTLVQYDLVIAPLSFDGEAEYRISNVRGLGKPDILPSGPSAVIGMPAMVGRHVQIDTRSLAENGGLQTKFLTAAPAVTPTSYHVPLTRLVADPGAGQVEPTDPLPTYADLPMVSVRTGFGDRSSTGISLVDTGAQLSMITTQTATELGVNLDENSATSDIQGYLEVGGIGGSVNAPLVVIDRLVIPTAEGTDLVLTNVVAGVVDIPGIGGIFGMNLLTSGQVPAILGEGEPGYFDAINFDFEGADWTMRMDVNPDFHVTGAKARMLKPRANMASMFTWDKSSQEWTADGATFTAYRDNDFVSFDGTVGPRNVNIAQEVRPAWVSFDGAADYTIAGQAIAGTTGLTKRGTGTVRIQNGNTYTGRTDVREGKVVFAAPQDIGDVFVQPAGTVEFETSQNLAALRIADGRATVTGAGAKKLLKVQDFNASGTGTLDLTDNDMLVQVPFIEDILDPTLNVDPADVFAQVRDLVVQGRDGGRWQGAGLTSSAAAADSITGLAAILNDDGDGNAIFTTFAGETVDERSILVKYTYNGDANLDGRVNADDYFRIDSAFLAQLSDPTWRDGDFNYDGRINADDYFLIDSSFLGQGGVLGGGVMRAVSVPEPGALGALLLGAGVLSRRCRRRH